VWLLSVKNDKARALIDMEEQIDLLEKSILSKAFSGELGTNEQHQ
jgi:type I restriction enzyme S subunit